MQAGREDAAHCTRGALSPHSNDIDLNQGHLLCFPPRFPYAPGMS
jgi:hypothetical protein